MGSNSSTLKGKSILLQQRGRKGPVSHRKLCKLSHNKSENESISGTIFCWPFVPFLSHSINKNELVAQSGKIAAVKGFSIP